MQSVATQETQLGTLLLMTDTGGLLDAVKVHLYKNNLNPDPTTPLATFTAAQADYTGYAAVSVGVWGAPYIAIDGLAHVTAPSKQFQATDAVNPNTIYGAYATNTGGTVLIYFVVFDTPVSLINALQALIFTPDYVYGS
jgi:hypothetical protein